MAQGDTVEHFKTRPEGALMFTRLTLSREMKNRMELETRTESNPIAFSSERARVVTRPDVERPLCFGLSIWSRKGEQLMD